MGSGLTKKAKTKVEASQYVTPPSPKLDLSNCDQRKFPNGLIKLDYVRDLNRFYLAQLHLSHPQQHRKYELADSA